jgi:hypothetical protein
MWYQQQYKHVVSAAAQTCGVSSSTNMWYQQNYKHMLLMRTVAAATMAMIEASY